MANNETVANIRDDMFQVVADEFGFVTMAQSDFVEYAERFVASHNRECEQLNAEIEAMSKFNDTLNAQMNELEHKLAEQREINKEVINDNDMLLDENYQLRNELRIAKKREEDIKYEYEIECKSEEGWITDAKGFENLYEAQVNINNLRRIFPNEKFRIVRRHTDWEVVK